MAAAVWYVAGHTGLLGSALARRLGGRADVRLVTATRAQLDLTHPRAVDAFLQRERPDVVVMAAGTIGGIAANACRPAEFIYQNLMIEANVIHGAWKAGVARLLNFGSGCMYPKYCPQPMRPEHLMTGMLEPTSEPYAMAKLAGWSMCAAYNRQYGTRFLTAIPATLYGPGDHVEPDGAHVIPALLTKFHQAKAGRQEAVTLWGTGQARREFLYVDDAAEACERLLECGTTDAPINMGSGRAQTIQELAALIVRVVGYEGRLVWDASRPDGSPEKLLDSSVLRGLGWAPRTDLLAGLRRAYAWFITHQAEGVTPEVACISS